MPVVCRRQTRVGGLFAEDPSTLFDGAGGEGVIHSKEWGNRGNRRTEGGERRKRCWSCVVSFSTRSPVLIESVEYMVIGALIK